MEVWRAARETSQDWSFDLANMVEFAVDQGLAGIRGVLASARRQARNRICFTDQYDRQVTDFQTS